MIALLRAAALTSLVVCVSTCKEDRPAVPDGCRESIERSRRLLSGPDLAAARGAADDAKKQCSAEQQGEVSALQREIEAAEAKQREAEAKKQAELASKAAAASPIPAFVDAVKSYRAEKGRNGCTERTCKGNRNVGDLSATVATARGQANAFSVFLTFKEHVGCGRFGTNLRKQAWKADGREKEYCLLKEGQLKGLGVLTEHQKSPPETDVTVFTEAWVGHDEQFRKELEVGKPPKP